MFLSHDRRHLCGEHRNRSRPERTRLFLRHSGLGASAYRKNTRQLIKYSTHQLNCVPDHDNCNRPPQSPTMQLTANQVLQRHYLGFSEGFVMVYDTARPESLDVLMYLKKDIDRNKDKKEVVILVIGNRTGPDDPNSLENTCSKASNWCAREKVRHFEVNAMDRPSLYEPFIFMTSKLNPVQNKTTFPQLSTLSKLTQKNNKSEAM
ncbi:NF-kappa-B inhibitor-interacting Ras-like protein isoform X3 [Bombyx mori]|uniref:NF-kappa-B inhibitor-interacting Ras-like protein n=1 Tax=Bombyx mori TaxID=7091 RepID=A0A8R1WHE7_BOMMO|nr:NF-kappa-B inhibitor-interacting Ras-like protein isoform X3 [Bombyx mori]